MGPDSKSLPLIAFALATLAFIFPTASSINCYTCSSRNRTEFGCHDPFHPYNTTYVTSCKVPKEYHVGLFPAAFCVKVIGTSETTHEELVIRACSLENMDNQCGEFIFQQEKMRGCILTCNIDGCNGALGTTSSRSNVRTLMAFVSSALSLLFVSCLIN